MIKLKALKHMQNLRANLKSNYLLGIILRLDYFLPRTSAYCAFRRSLIWTKMFFHDNKGTTKFNKHTKFSGFGPKRKLKKTSPFRRKWRYFQRDLVPMEHIFQMTNLRTYCSCYPHNFKILNQSSKKRYLQNAATKDPIKN